MIVGMFRGSLAFAAVLALVQANARGETPVKHGFIDRVYKDSSGDTAKYVIFVPHGYKGDTAFPLILFLHGAGETGSDGIKQAKVGLGPAIKKHEKDFPCIVIFPQSQKKTWKAGSKDADRALAILEEIRREYKVDPNRIYLTGLSMGGMGTWSVAPAHPELWAAIVPICGRGNVKDAIKIKDIPCWCFHGDADKSVAVKGSRDMIAALKAAGGSPKYTEYPGVGHNSWDRAYATPELYTWLLEQHRKSS